MDPELWDVSREGVAELARIATALEGILLRLTPAEERERTSLIDGYVRGESSKGDPLVYLYAPLRGEFPQYRICTVYVERFGDLRPFCDPGVGRVFEGEAAPTRAKAERTGLFNAVPAFEVVLEPTGQQTDTGNAIFRFRAARGVAHEPGGNGAEAPGSGGAEEQRAASGAPAGGNGKPAARQAALTAGKTAGLFKNWARDFAQRYPRYKLRGSEDADLYHLLMTVGSFGIADITAENLADVQARLEAHAERGA